MFRVLLCKISTLESPLYSCLPMLPCLSLSLVRSVLSEVGLVSVSVIVCLPTCVLISIWSLSALKVVFSPLGSHVSMFASHFVYVMFMFYCDSLCASWLVLIPFVPLSVFSSAVSSQVSPLHPVCPSFSDFINWSKPTVLPLNTSTTAR